MAKVIRMIFTLDGDIEPEKFGEHVMCALVRQGILKDGEYAVVPDVAVYTVKTEKVVNEYLQPTFTTTSLEGVD